MNKNSLLLCAVLFSLSLVSCTKEAETPSGIIYDITGTWKLVNLQAQTSTTLQATAGSDVIKTVTTSSYTTQNNTGTITITSAAMAANNLSYAINTVAKVSIYENGTLTDTLSQPLQAAIPAYTSTFAYTRVSADSIYFPAGSLTMGGATQATLPGGSKIKPEQNMLYMIQSGTQTTTSTSQGQTVTSVASVSSTSTFQRQ